MNNPTPNTQIKLAELLPALAEAGFTFIRIKTLDKRPEGKWSKERITPAQVLSRIKEGRNYGIVPPADCFILDFDSDEAYQRSIALEPVIAISLTFKTPRGYHVLFEGEGIPQGASHTCLGQGVDVRTGSKGYVVGPGSKRKDGHYEYLHRDSIEPVIEHVPESLRKLLQKPASVPTAEIFPDGLPQSGKPAESPVASPGSIPEGHRPLTADEADEAASKHWKALEAVEPTQEGERNDTLARASCGLGSLYANQDREKKIEIQNRLIEYAILFGNGDSAKIERNKNTVIAQLRYGAKSPASRPIDEESPYRIIFSKFDSQEFEQALANLNISVRNNDERDKIEYLIVDDGSWPIPTGFGFKIGEWFECDSKMEGTLIYNLNRYFGKQKNKNVVGVRCILTDFRQWSAGIAAQNPYHPFRTYIDGCQTNPELEGLTLTNWLKPWVPNSESKLNQWIMEAILIGIVQKVYRDNQGCRVIPVLRGERGIGKTTLVSELIPKDFRHYFGQFTVMRKSEMVGSLRGKFLCEFGELDGMNGSMVSSFKEFIGNPINTSRLSYEPHHLDYPNTAFIIGTSNPERNVPNDDALLSRLAFIDLEKAQDPKEYLPDKLEHLYALARDAYKAGKVVGVLDEHLEDEQKQASEESVIMNEIMQERIESMDLRCLSDLFRLNDAYRSAGLVSLRNDRAPAGAQKAMKAQLKAWGVGLKREDIIQKKGIRFYQMSDQMKKIREEQLKERGQPEMIYGYRKGKVDNTDTGDDFDIL